MNIVVDQITKEYGTQRAVDDLSFTVRTGEILGFLGPNGAGKTTTMKAITCYLTPNSGDILVGGLSVRKNGEAIKQRVGYLPEHNPLYLDMGVIDYLKFVAELQGVPKGKIIERTREMIRICGLQKEKHKKIGELSKGYRQRVGLAQALIHDPEVLILDEPTTGLDPNQIVEIRELIRKVGQEKTVILSSHILAEVEATCDRIIIINNGKIVAEGTADELRKQARHQEVLYVQIEGDELLKVTEALLQLDSVDDVLQRGDGHDGMEVISRAGQSSRKAIFSLCVEKGWFLTELTPVETKLEDVFREVTKN